MFVCRDTYIYIYIYTHTYITHIQYREVPRRAVLNRAVPCRANPLTFRGNHLSNTTRLTQVLFECVRRVASRKNHEVVEDM